MVIGRRGALWIASVLCCVSNAIMMASTDINALYVGRLVLGISNGMYMTFPQLYLQVRTSKVLSRSMETQY